MKTLIALTLAGFLVGIAADACAANAGEQEAKPQAADEERIVVCRVTGLFSPDREAELRTAVDQIPGVRLVGVEFDFAEATFAYDPASAFRGTKPDKVAERLDQLLRAASGHTLGAKPRSTTPRDKLVRVEIGVAPLDCKACALGVYEIVAKVAGVEQAAVSMGEGRVTALIDPEKTGREALRAALKAREVRLREP